MNARSRLMLLLQITLSAAAAVAIASGAYSRGRLFDAVGLEDMKKELTRALTFHASFDRGTDADFALGDRRIFTATSYKKREDAAPGLAHPDVSVAAGQGRHGSALQFRKKNVKAVYYQGEKNVAFSNSSWSGSASFWLSLDPDSDLEPGYCDPIQLTDKDYNDSAIWVDFTRDDKPRHFRLGLFGRLRDWNPENIGPDKNPKFNKRLITVTNPPFASGQWTHVVITFSGLNAPSPGHGRLYLNGGLAGTSEGISEAFSWDLSRAAIRLGLNYTGLYDDLAVFNRALSDAEVRFLGRLKGGASELR